MITESTVTTVTPEPGIYFKVPFDYYVKWEALNASLIIAGARTMRHLRHEMQTPRSDTRALTTGRAAHVLTYEPEEFESQYIILPEGDARKKDIKDARENALCEAVATGRVPLRFDEFTDARAVADAVRDFPAARELIDAPGQAEISIVWIDKPSGVKCKARLDRFCNWNGYSIVSDLKTTTDAGERAFRSSIWRYSYHIRTAFYLDGLAALSECPRRWVWMVVEKSKPNGVALYEPEIEVINEGRVQYQTIIQEYAKCLSTGEWPGYPDGILPITLWPNSIE
jgi:exodeoxyribonuclease VIII